MTALSAILLAASTLSISPEMIDSGMAGRRETLWYRHEGFVSAPGPADRFSVVKPAKENSAPSPLLVVLHWRGGGLPGKGVDMQTALSDEKDRVFSAPDDFYILNLDDIRNYNVLTGSEHDDYWWGATSAYKGPVPQDVPRLYLKETTCEKRILATVEWTASNFPVDRDRIYLCGNSMGGQAATAIGLAHGDIFAAVNANVPATPWYAFARLGLDKAPFASLFPDPPVYVEWNGVDDIWSRDRHVIVDALALRKWPHIVLWGDFGHCGSVAEARKKNDLVEKFDWLSVRRRDAYAVFTNASCDDVLPWPFAVWEPKTRLFGAWAGDIYDAEMEIPSKAPKSGQINAFFRWRNIKDSEDAFSIGLYIASPEELGSSLFDTPGSAIADVTLQRIQSQAVRNAEFLEWTYGDMSGTICKRPGESPTIENIPVERTMRILTLRPGKGKATAK